MDEGPMIVAELVNNPVRTQLLPVAGYFCRAIVPWIGSITPARFALATVQQMLSIASDHKVVLAAIAAGQPELDGETTTWISSTLREADPKDEDYILGALVGARQRVQNEAVLAQLGFEPVRWAAGRKVESACSGL